MIFTYDNSSSPSLSSKDASNSGMYVPNLFFVFAVSHLTLLARRLEGHPICKSLLKQFSVEAK